MLQQTLKESISFCGKGLHTGLDVTLTLCPAEENEGYTICRTDLEGKPEIKALAEFVQSTQRGTLLKKGEVTAGTIEHCLSALYAMGVDNCRMEINAPEFPILDGSALPYVREIARVGLVEQKNEREYYVVKKRVEVKAPEGDSSIVLLPDDEFGVDVHISFPSVFLSNQYASMQGFDTYAEKVAPARTFVFVREILPLLKQGLIKGGDLSNALVISDSVLSSEEQEQLLQLLPSIDSSRIGEMGLLNAKDQFSNEPAVHKLLDVVGDLALCGKFIKGHIIANAPGHTINTQAAKEIRKELKSIECQAPCYDPDKAPLLDINAIKQLLPHRYPFLLVDKVVEMGKEYVVGVKSVTGNEPFFVGHFPEEPVMPGVLIVEAMAQTGGVLVLYQMGQPKDCSTYFLKIDGVKFRQKVVPGDTLVFKLRMMSEIRRGVANMRGLAFVGNKLVCEADFMAQIVINQQ